jgi:fluoride ion exporter CrcB/FEX
MQVTLGMLYIVGILAILFRLWAQSGWDWKPMFYEGGKFQLNIVGTVLIGFITAYPVIQAIPLNQEPVILILTTFMTIYGTPAVVDKLLTRSPIGNSPQEEVQEEALP